MYILATVELHQQRTTRPQTTAPEERELEFSSDELAQVLKEASSLQAMKQGSGRDVATLQEALETARELGIGEENVLEAAAGLRRRKDHLLRLRRVVRVRRNNVLRMIATTAGVVALVAFAGGLDAARAVLFGMSIAVLVLSGKWVKSLLALRYPDVFDTPQPGECRICGNPAWKKQTRLCEEHRDAPP